jgi:hypothetical protein
LTNNQTKSKAGRGGKRAGAGRKPGARTKAKLEIMEAAKVYTTEALETLAHVMRTGDSEAARVAAADKLLDRGHGKAPQPQTGADGKSPIALAISWLQPQL